MSIDEKAFEAFMLAYHGNGGTGLGLRKCLEAYEAAKASGQPIRCKENFEKWWQESDEMPLPDLPSTTKKDWARAGWNAAKDLLYWISEDTSTNNRNRINRIISGCMTRGMSSEAITDEVCEYLKLQKVIYE